MQTSLEMFDIKLCMNVLHILEDAATQSEAASPK